MWKSCSDEQWTLIKHVIFVDLQAFEWVKRRKDRQLNEYKRIKGNTKRDVEIKERKIEKLNEIENRNKWILTFSKIVV